MKKNRSPGGIGITILVVPLLIGIGFVSSKTAYGQIPDFGPPPDMRRSVGGRQNPRGRNWELYGNYGGSSQLRQAALSAGYESGISEGISDRETGRSADLRRQGTYQRATKDYSGGLGDRELYRRYFREGFEEAYSTERYIHRTHDDLRDRTGKQNQRDRNIDGYTNYGGSFQLRQTALNAGFNEGTKQGRLDRYKRNSEGYQAQSTYRNANKDYSARLGDRGIYQRYFREAYEQGYRDGYNTN